MRVSSSIAAFFVGLFVVSFAPLARADGFFITFKDARTGAVVLSRTAGAVFDASAAAPVDPATGLPTGHLSTQPVHIEFDDFKPATPLASTMAPFLNMSAVVEFTTPDASGVEQVNMTAHYTNVTTTGWQITFDPKGTPVFKLGIDYVFYSVTYDTPPPASAGAGAKPIPKVGMKLAPKVSRTGVAQQMINGRAGMTAATAAAPAHIQDAYMQSANITGESTDHPGQTKLTSLTIKMVQPRDPSTGDLSAQRQMFPLAITKANGAANTSIQSLMTNRQTAPAITVNFVEHRAAVDQTLLTLVLTNAAVAADSTQIGGATAGESTSFRFQRVGYTDSTTHASASVDWPTTN